MPTSAWDESEIFFELYKNVPLEASISFFFNDTATTEIYTLSLHDALPIFGATATSGTVSSGAASATFSLPGGTPTGTYTIVADYSGTANLEIGTAHA